MMILGLNQVYVHAELIRYSEDLPNLPNKTSSQQMQERERLKREHELFQREYFEQYQNTSNSKWMPIKTEDGRMVCPEGSHYSVIHAYDDPCVPDR